MIEAIDSALSDNDGIEKAYADHHTKSDKLSIETLTAISPQRGQTPSTSGVLAGETAANSISSSVSATTDLSQVNSDDLLGKLGGQEQVVFEKAVSSMPSVTTTTPTMQATATAQIAAAIKIDRAANDIEIRLDPPEMGRVRLSFSLDGGEGVKAVLTAEHGQTLDYLRKHSDDLAKALEAAGFESIDLTFSENKTTFTAESTEFDEGFSDELPQVTEGHTDMIYLSLRDDAQLDVLV